MAVTIDLTPNVSDNDIWLADLVGTPNIQYYGFAKPGTSQTTPSWKLYILNLDPTSQVPIGKQFAGGTPAYVNQWSLRTSYVYS